MMPEPELAEFHLQDLSMNQHLEPELLSPGWESAALGTCCADPLCSDTCAV